MGNTKIKTKDIKEVKDILLKADKIIKETTNYKIINGDI